MQEMRTKDEVITSIKYYREKRGLSQSELAEKLNVTTVHIQDIEEGRQDFSIDDLDNIFKAMDYSFMFSVLDSSVTYGWQS